MFEKFFEDEKLTITTFSRRFAKYQGLFLIQMHICMCRAAARASKWQCCVRRRLLLRGATWWPCALALLLIRFVSKWKYVGFLTIFRRFSFPVPLLHSAFSSRERNLLSLSSQGDGSRNGALLALKSSPNVGNDFRPKEKEYHSFCKCSTSTVRIDTE